MFKRGFNKVVISIGCIHSRGYVTMRPLNALRQNSSFPLPPPQSTIHIMHRWGRVKNQYVALLHVSSPSLSSDNKEKDSDSSPNEEWETMRGMTYKEGQQGEAENVDQDSHQQSLDNNAELKDSEVAVYRVRPLTLFSLSSHPRLSARERQIKICM
jgi:hypothetical protein